MNFWSGPYLRRLSTKGSEREGTSGRAGQSEAPRVEQRGSENARGKSRARAGNGRRAYSSGLVMYVFSYSTSSSPSPYGSSSKVIFASRRSCDSTWYPGPLARSKAVNFRRGAKIEMGEVCTRKTALSLCTEKTTGRVSLAALKSCRNAVLCPCGGCGHLATRGGKELRGKGSPLAAKQSRTKETTAHDA